MPAFATTRWTLIARARGDSAEARQARQELCRAYWPPIYAFLRRGNEPERALDLAQGFFEYLIEHDLVARFDPERGRFRSFLLGVLRRYVADGLARERAVRRGGGVELVPIDVASAEHLAGLVCDGDTPERAWERAWARAVMERAMAALREEVAGPDTAHRFDALCGLMTGTLDESYVQVGPRLSMSEAAVKTAVSRLRRRYGEILRDQVRQTEALSTDEEVDDELRGLLELLGGGSA